MFSLAYPKAESAHQESSTYVTIIPDCHASCTLNSHMLTTSYTTRSHSIEYGAWVHYYIEECMALLASGSDPTA